MFEQRLALLLELALNAQRRLGAQKVRQSRSAAVPELEGGHGARHAVEEFTLDRRSRGRQAGVKGMDAVVSATQQTREERQASPRQRAVELASAQPVNLDEHQSRLGRRGRRLRQTQNGRGPLAPAEKPSYRPQPREPARDHGRSAPPSRLRNSSPAAVPG